MQVLQQGGVEGVDDFPAVDVQGNDPAHAHHLVDVAEQAGGKAFPSLLLVLAAVGE